METHGCILSQITHVSPAPLPLNSVSVYNTSPSTSRNPKGLGFVKKPFSSLNRVSVFEKTAGRISFERESFFNVMSAAQTQEKETVSLNGKADEKMVEFLEFSKYHGLGNDFILVDNRDNDEPKISPGQAKKICNRNFGVGADGVIFALPGKEGSDYAMRIYNSDGSEPEMCGNGIRCMARFVAELEGLKNEKEIYRVDTLGGVMVLDLREDGQVKVDMGPPTLSSTSVPVSLSPSVAESRAVVAVPLEIDGRVWTVTCVSMGNPHCVTFQNNKEKNLKVDELDLARIGPMFEKHPSFPARINTEFVEVLSRSELKMRVWERGAGATLACGTGACALVVAGVLEGRAERKCTVHLPGGPLEIEWREENDHVYMTGPAELVFHGKVYL